MKKIILAFALLFGLGIATYWDTSINDHYYDLCYNVKYISVYH